MDCSNSVVLSWLSMLLLCVSVLVLFSTYVRVDDIYFGIGSSPCMRCTVHFAEAGNGDTVNQRCTGAG